MRKSFGTLTAALLLSATLALPTQAANVAMGWSWYYTPTLADNLTARGDQVSVLQDYDAATLSAFDVFILDGTTRANAAELDAFVYQGGTLILQPLSMRYAGITPGLSVAGGYHHMAHAESQPGIEVLADYDWLLKGVTLPAAGSATVGREIGTAFAEGATQVLEWEDGAALLGYRQYGAGTVIGFNVNLVTGDASPLDAEWSNRIVYNAIDAAAVSAVPEPATHVMLGAGLLALAAWRRRARDTKR
ncbi:PEP-CTERM sorting domain-containing protein [Pseudoduganella sp. SL102]|uniref:PEP-CTERM sorting domain-containing protein n=1 Tax=Pseudoduganella sp. SL102 TaxID=2995154 RepID=UPI00248BE6A0|nr:PEP-CTERM sorting domain-containing protein [Pseudoduganella sp. SL102]WBS04393.1 PEP-CTERM sorting domain-containing protein [Pseudoduganella sp. SL102]